MLSARIARAALRRTPHPPRLSGTQRRLQSTQKPFRQQLYDSTAQRIQTEQARARRQLQAGEEAGDRRASGGSQTLATLVGMAMVAVSFYYLGTGAAAPVSAYIFPGAGSGPGSASASTTPLAAVPPPTHNTSASNLEAAWAEFAALLGREHVRTEPDELARHATSDWTSHLPTPAAAASTPSATANTAAAASYASCTPFLVLYPATTEDVASIARICHARRIPMTAFSGGTSVEGHFAATRGGVSIDFSRMDRIVALHPADLDVAVQPGVGWERLNDELAAHGLFFPPDPGPGALIGGMVATGCSGTNAARHGPMRDWVLALTVVLADGTVIRTRRRPRKSAAGYDLTRLFVGSEGTLGLVTEATLRLAVRAPSESVAVASFPSVAHAAATAAAVVAAGVPLAAAELLDDVAMRCINAAGATTRTHWREAPTLFFKFAGTPAAVAEQEAHVRRLAAQHGAASFELAASPAERHELWSARKEVLWAVMALRRDPADAPPDDGGAGGGTDGAGDSVWTTDVAVPLSALATIVQETKDDMAARGLLGAIVGHVGDGNFHAILLFSPRRARERAAAEAVVHRMVARAIALDGTVSGEHGVGLGKRDYLPLELGPAAVDTMRRLKLALDPLCLLNCDKVVRIEPAGARGR